MTLIEKKIENEIGIITLNDSRHLNALSAQLLNEIIESLNEFKDTTLAVIIRAPKGSKVFSAGHDIHELPKHARDPLTYWDPLRKAVRALQEFPHPIIAMIEGSVWGGAFELVMSCDILIASNTSTFAITPAKLGVPYNLSGVHNLIKNISIPNMKEMLFTAKPITAEKAMILGIINYSLPVEKIENFTYEMIDDIKKNSPLAISVIKEEIRVLSASSSINPEAYEKIQAGRRLVYDSEDYTEGITSFLEKRKPVFKGK
jgi:methylmalonyl-CoA decarboxylase